MNQLSKLDAFVEAIKLNKRSSLKKIKQANIYLRYVVWTVLPGPMLILYAINERWNLLVGYIVVHVWALTAIFFTFKLHRANCPNCEDKCFKKGKILADVHVSECPHCVYRLENSAIP